MNTYLFMIIAKLSIGKSESDIFPILVYWRPPARHLEYEHNYV
jgi:hypothetical protein